MVNFSNQNINGTAMKKFAFLSFLLLSAAILFAQTSDHLNCFAVLAGKDATTDGSVLLAHPKKP